MYFDIHKSMKIGNREISPSHLVIAEIGITTGVIEVAKNMVRLALSGRM